MNDEQFDDLIAGALQTRPAPDLWPSVRRTIRPPWPTVSDLTLYAAASVLALILLGFWKASSPQVPVGSWVAPVAMQPPDEITFDGRPRG